MKLSAWFPCRWCRIPTVPASPASNALFALTLPAAAGYLAGTVTLLLQGAGKTGWTAWAFPVVIFWVLLPGSGFWLLLLANRFCHRSFPDSWKRDWTWAAMTVALIFSVAAAMLPGRALTLPVIWILFFGWLLPLPAARKTSRGAVVCVWLAAPLFLTGAALFANCLFSPFLFSDPLQRYLPALPVLPVGAESAFFGLPLLAAGYLLWAKLLAELGRIPFRRIFGTGTRLLWGAILAAYLVSLVFSYSAERRLAETCAQLEQRFGQPLTVKALQELRLARSNPDPAYWEELFHSLPQSDDATALETKWESWHPGRFTELPDREAEEYAALLKKIDFTALDRLIDSEKTKNDTPLPVSAIRSLKVLASIEFRRAWAELRLGRLDEARRQERRMFRLSARLRGEISLAAHFTANSVDHLRLDLLELMLENGNLSDAELHNFSRELENLEAESLRIPENVWYADAVRIHNFLSGLYGDSPEAEHRGSPSGFGVATRLLLPQYRYLLVNDHIWTLEECATFDPAAPPLPQRKGGIFCNMLGHSELQSHLAVWNRSRLARLRAERALITAELTFRETGIRTVRPDSLPADPFSGRPLLYRFGPCRTDSVTTVPALQIWSTGPDGVDDGGLSGSNGADDIRAVRRLP